MWQYTATACELLPGCAESISIRWSSATCGAVATIGSHRAWRSNTKHARGSHPALPNLAIEVCGHGGGSESTALHSSQRLFVFYWLCEAISQAYLPSGAGPWGTIRAHSTGEISSSMAPHRGMTVVDICAAASWSSPYSFIQFYLRDVSHSLWLTHSNLYLNRDRDEAYTVGGHGQFHSKFV